MKSMAAFQPVVSLDGHGGWMGVWDRKQVMLVGIVRTGQEQATQEAQEWDGMDTVASSRKYRAVPSSESGDVERRTGDLKNLMLYFWFGFWFWF